MKIASIATDNISEMLLRIIEFTERRHELLRQNIIEANTEGFVPQDLDLDEFVDSMSGAVSEYVQSKRLLLCGGENIKFGANGDFEPFPIVDRYAKEILKEDTKEYQKLQIEKLSENLYNNKTAIGLLEKAQQGKGIRRF